MRRAFHPGHAILVNLGIDAKNVTSFKIECESVEHLPTITLTQVIFGLPEPTYAVITREVIGFEAVGSDQGGAA
jgi:hypothetical protein